MQLQQQSLPNQAANAANKSSPRPQKHDSFSLRALKPILTPTPRILTRSNSRCTDVSAHRYIDRSPTTANTAASRPPLRPHASSQPEIAKPIQSEDDATASISNRRPKPPSLELGSPVTLLFWTEIAFGKMPNTGRGSPAGTRQEGRQASGSASLRNRGLKTSKAFTHANSSAVNKGNATAQFSLKSPKARNQGQHPALTMPAADDKDMRIVRQGLQVRLKDANCFHKEKDGWLGFIQKHKAKSGAANKLVTSSVGVGVGDLSTIALTGSQWIYGVAARNGQVHVCSINMGAILIAAVHYIYENQKRLRQEAKIEGYWPRFRVTIELPESDTIFKWLCDHEQQSHKQLSRRWSMKNVGSAPTPGLIRQDLTWSISPLRSMLSEATGLKGSFIPISKFGKGYKRWLLSGSTSTLCEGRIPAYDHLELSAAPAAWNSKFHSSTNEEFTISPKEVSVREAECCSDNFSESKSDVLPPIIDITVPRMLAFTEALSRVP